MKNLRFYLFLVALSLGAGPAGAALWQWSLTPATNGSADPTVNWAVGMAPSAVGPSARAMMARMAEYRDDISGSLVTGGSSTAYTVTTNQATGGNGLCSVGGATAPTDGQMIAITPNATNGVAPSLTADSCVAAPIQSASAVPVGAGTLIAGTPYSLKYSVSNTAWMLRDFFGNPYATPLGGLMPYTLQSVPNSNFVFPAGQCLSTTTYAAYWTALGGPPSGSCPGGQFRIIDLSGRVMAGLDTMPGFTAAGRLTGATNGCGTAMLAVGTVCPNGNESQTLNATQLPTISSNNPSQSITVADALGRNIPATAGSIGQVVVSPGASSAVPFSAITWGTMTQMVGNNNITVTSTNTGGLPHPNIPPIIGVTYLLRVI